MEETGVPDNLMILCSIPGDSLHNIYVSNKHIKINIIKKKRFTRKE
jgi:hypothetical protein